jgi:hypothetical protein
MIKRYNLVDPAAEVKRHIRRRYKTQVAAARAWGVTPAFVNMVVQGIKNPTEIMLQEMGVLRKTIYYRERRGRAAGSGVKDD